METKSGQTHENTLSFDSQSLGSKQRETHPFLFTAQRPWIRSHSLKLDQCTNNQDVIKELMQKVRPVQEEEVEQEEERKPRFQRYLSLMDKKEDSYFDNKVKSRSLDPKDVIEEIHEEDKQFKQIPRISLPIDRQEKIQAFEVLENSQNPKEFLMNSQDTIKEEKNEEDEEVKRTRSRIFPQNLIADIIDKNVETYDCEIQEVIEEEEYVEEKDHKNPCQQKLELNIEVFNDYFENIKKADQIGLSS